MNSDRNLNRDRLYVNGNNWNDNNKGYAFGMALATKMLICLKLIIISTIILLAGKTYFLLGEKQEKEKLKKIM